MGRDGEDKMTVFHNTNLRELLDHRDNSMLYSHLMLVKAFLLTIAIVGSISFKFEKCAWQNMPQCDTCIVIFFFKKKAVLTVNSVAFL